MKKDAAQLCVPIWQSAAGEVARHQAEPAYLRWLSHKRDRRAQASQPICQKTSSIPARH